MARKNLIISFLSSVPESIRAQLKDETIFAHCPVSQSAICTPCSAGAHNPQCGTNRCPTGQGKKDVVWPGGRQGYQLWLSRYRDGNGNVIPGIARAHGLGQGDEIGKVCVMGFSNGCIGVDEVLRAADAQRIDTVLVVDGIHGSFVGNRMPSPAQYKNYMNQAAHVAQFNAETDRNAPVMVITHSCVEPGSYPNTTTTAEIIWNAVYPLLPQDYIPVEIGWGAVPWLHLESIRARYAEPVTYQGDPVGCNKNAKPTTWYGIEDTWYDKRGANNFYVLGWGVPGVGKYTTKDPTGCADHIFQGQTVLNALLDEFVVQRWNTNCGQVATAGLGGEPEVCILPAGVNYETASAQKIDYFPNLDDATPVPTPCPFPPPGRKIVGSPTDPCALDEPLKDPSAPPSAEDSDSKKWLAAAAGFAIGYGLAWYGGKLYRDR